MGESSPSGVWGPHSTLAEDGPIGLMLLKCSYKSDPHLWWLDEPDDGLLADEPY